ncbi:hypothetical protein BGZ70_000150 [Mortierella alpina]|uniref:BZIP domain-containing protein n=1 Tax=Mortierella alpina TaxID=64518 RepID=A0A9P6LZC3_MORAP|nr:hypothetical protein BGZ70_000150 [Mortierella alpina]
MANPMFDDFLELDLLDPSEASSDMFSYYLDPVPDQDPAAVALAATGPALSALEPPAAADLPIKQEDDDDAAASADPRMLLDPIPAADIVFADPALALVSPAQLTIAPQVTTIVPATNSLSTIAPSDLTAPSAASHATAPTSPSTSVTPSKRTSPEPTTSPRKHSKTASVSRSKTSTTSSRKSSTAAATASAAAAASSDASSKLPNSPKSTTSTASSSTASSAKATSKSPTPASESVTSPVNTTLSAATLQFLLQQQEDTPLIPQLFTGKLSREEIEATLARLLESTKHLLASTAEEDSMKIKQEPMSDEESDDGMDGITHDGDGAEQTHGLKTQPGIKTDDIPSSTDLKKMTSKERRQLRNKISARNFRVRRKEYIVTLEGQVLQHKTEARHLREAVTLVQEENLRLKDELEIVRRKLAETTLASAASDATMLPMTVGCQEQAAAAQVAGSTSPLSKENEKLLTSIMNNRSSPLNPNAKSNLTLSMARPQSPILTPNLFKDVPNSSSGSASQNSWKDKNPIMVHTTLVPEICFGDEFQFGSKPSKSKDDEMSDRPWMRLLEQETRHDFDSTLSINNPLLTSGLMYELMQTFTVMTMAFNPSAHSNQAVSMADEEEAPSDEDTEHEIDWELQESLWASVRATADVEDEEHIQVLYDLAQLQISPVRSVDATSSLSGTAQEDPNMLEWLYESMMARLVDLDLQGAQDHVHGSFSEPHLA